MNAIEPNEEVATVDEKIDNLNISVGELREMDKLNEELLKDMEFENNETIEETYTQAIASINEEINKEKDIERLASLKELKNTVSDGLRDHNFLSSVEAKNIQKELFSLAETTSLKESAVLIQENEFHKNQDKSVSSAWINIPLVTIVLTNRATVTRGVRAIIAVFSKSKLWLSAELLQTALDNRNPNMTKYPRNIDRLKGTIAINAIFRHRPFGNGGKALFQNQNNAIEADGKFAIQNFTYNKYRQNGKIHILLIDRYDFHMDDHNSNLFVNGGKAVMTYAQRIGVITPFHVRHVFK